MTGLRAAVDIAVAAGFFGVVAYYWSTVLRGAARHERSVRKEHTRAALAHYAAIEAAEDDPAFSPDVIDQSIVDIVALAGGIWGPESVGALDGRPDASLVKAWARSWQWLGDGLEVTARPSIDLIGVVNRNDEEEDQVVARVRFRIHCKYPKSGVLGPHHGIVDERWILGRSGTQWVLRSVSGDPLTGPVLAAALIPNPQSDSERLSNESLAELADRQKPGDDVALSGLVNADDPPAFALQDLSVVDSRFGPELIAAQLGHLLEAWEIAANGSEGPLEERASEDARSALLRPRRGTRLIVRDVGLKSWEPTDLDLSRRPPAIEITVEVEAVRYVVRDDGSPLAGNQRDARQIDLTWTLELTDSVRNPWWLAASNSPGKEVPGLP